LTNKDYKHMINQICILIGLLHLWHLLVCGSWLQL